MSSMLEALAGLLLVFTFFLIMMGIVRLEEHLKKPKDKKEDKEDIDIKEPNIKNKNKEDL